MKIDDLPSRCFTGIVPSLVATSDADGVPNVTYLSSIERLEGDRMALTCQFFNKTKRNVLAHPRACFEIYDPLTFEAFRVEARYHHEETEGPLFDRMKNRLDVIASHVGMKGIFKLRSADVYDVLSVERRDGFLDGTELVVTAMAADPGGFTEVRALQVVSGRIRRAQTLDSLLHELFAALDEVLGFRHGMVLVPDETNSKLEVIDAYGYERDNIGAEIAFGECLFGSVASERRVMRMTGVDSELRYQRAIRAGIERRTPRTKLAPEIPLPGLPDAQSQLAIPLVTGDRLLGVLAFESRDQDAFDEWHEVFLEVVANQVAATMDGVLVREREEPEAVESHVAPARISEPTMDKKLFRFFPGDDCVFVDDEYLIQNLPARVLWYVLSTHAKSGRVDFTNRELRLESSLGLPRYRDNLESRLVLLRRRLAEKCPAVSLDSTGRGRFRLTTTAEIVLETRA